MADIKPPEEVPPAPPKEEGIPKPRDLSFFALQSEAENDIRVKLADIEINVPVVNKTFK
jgi:hypothetical protein